MYPTLVDLCDLREPPKLDGKSLVPLLLKPDQSTGRSVVTTQGYKNHAVRSKEWRYIRYADGAEELYNHRRDPNEFTNLAGMEEYSAIKKKLAGALPTMNHKPEGR